jgi:hypothetical protein
MRTTPSAWNAAFACFLSAAATHAQVIRTKTPSESTLQRAATGKLRPARLQPPRAGFSTAAASETKIMPFFSAAVLAAAAGELADMRAEEADSGPTGPVLFGSPTSWETAGGLGFSLGTWGCSARLGPRNGDDARDDTSNRRRNVRVNQDCTFRRQAEETIIFNPVDRNNLLAGQNDSRVGYNQCGISWSLDNGLHWGDLIPPFRQKHNNPAAEEPTAADPNRHTVVGGPGTIKTYDFGSDPAVAFDSAGRGFFSCLALDVVTDASLVYVTQSPPEAKGSYFFNLAPFSREWVVAEDNSPAASHDKEFIVADTNPRSPNRDNVYVTWTAFKFTPECNPEFPDAQDPAYCQSPIFGSMTTDHGLHWSTPELVSGAADALCFFGNFFDPAADPHACNFDQGSDPAVLPNGDLVVIFNNGNTSATNPNAQQLSVRCHPTGRSELGTARLNCAAPAFVGSDIVVGEPRCDFGRGPEECIPGAYIRTNDFPRITRNPTTPDTLFATWQDYQRRDDQTREFSIQMTRSTNGGLSWEPVRTINPDRGLDHYFPAVDVCKADKDDWSGRGCSSRVADSYYRTERVPNENTTPPTGFNPDTDPGVGRKNSDYVLAGGIWPDCSRDRSGACAAEASFAYQVLSPVFPPPDGNQTGFNGDYSGLTIKGDDEAHPIWSDTRNVDPRFNSTPNNGTIHDEDVFTVNTRVVYGTCAAHTGRVGRDRCSSASND